MQAQMFSLSRNLDEAHKAINEGHALESVLKQRIDELEDDKKDLVVHFYVLNLHHWLCTTFICRLLYFL